MPVCSQQSNNVELLQPLKKWFHLPHKREVSPFTHFLLEIEALYQKEPAGSSIGALKDVFYGLPGIIQLLENFYIIACLAFGYGFTSKRCSVLKCVLSAGCDDYCYSMSSGTRAFHHHCRFSMQDASKCASHRCLWSEWIALVMKQICQSFEAKENTKFNSNKNKRQLQGKTFSQSNFQARTPDLLGILFERPRGRGGEWGSMVSLVCWLVAWQAMARKAAVATQAPLCLFPPTLPIRCNLSWPGRQILADRPYRSFPSGLPARDKGGPAVLSGHSVLHPPSPAISMFFCFVVGVVLCFHCHSSDSGFNIGPDLFCGKFRLPAWISLGIPLRNLQWWLAGYMPNSGAVEVSSLSGGRDRPRSGLHPCWILQLAIPWHPLAGWG